ncbi:hypothetical protein D3C77_244060 [compost metagenome]
MTESNKDLLELKAELDSLKHEVRALKAGSAAAFAAVSAALREIPNYEPKIMEGMLTHSLKHGWPLADIPDNEVNETAFTGPLRFLLNDQKQARELFRQNPDQQK